MAVRLFTCQRSRQEDPRPKGRGFFHAHTGPDAARAGPGIMGRAANSRPASTSDGGGRYYAHFRPPAAESINRGLVKAPPDCADKSLGVLRRRPSASLAVVPVG